MKTQYLVITLVSPYANAWSVRLSAEQGTCISMEFPCCDLESAKQLAKTMGETMVNCYPWKG